MKSSPQQILDNWNQLNAIIEKTFSGSQKQNIMYMLETFQDRIVEAPASSRPNYHNCWVGGFLDHTLRVVNTALEMKNQFYLLGVEVTSSNADIVLAAMFHDFGKLGDLNHPYYIQQTDEWRRNKLNEWYTFNDKLEPMSVTDRALWLMQHFNIQVNMEVWKAIKMSDGLFDDGNTSLYKRPDTNRNILHYIIHFADWMSTIAEKQHYMQSLEESTPISDQVINKDKKVSDTTNVTDLKQKFDTLFND